MKAGFGALPNLIEHFRRQSARLGVLQTGMVGTQNPGQAIIEFMKNPMPKPDLFFGQTGKQRQFQQPIQSNFSQNHDPLQKGQQSQFPDQPGLAYFELLWSRLVGWRSAAAHRRHPAFAQLHPIAAGSAFRLGGKPSPIERWIKKVARAVAGKHPACSVGAVRSGRQAKNEKACLGITKPRHRFAPIVPVAKRPPFGSRDFFPPGDQPLASAASNKLFLQKL